MNIQKLEYISAVEKLKSFSKAADYCYISQSTLSTTINKYEEEIGIQIFNRHTRPISLTVEGELLMEHIRNVLFKVEELDQQIKEVKKDPSGGLRIGITPTIGPYLLNLFLPSFSKKNKELKLKIEEQNLETTLKNVKRRNIDLGIVPLPTFDLDLVEIPLYNEFLLLYDCSNLTSSSKEQTSLSNRIQNGNIDLENMILLEDEINYQNELEKLFEQYKRDEIITSNISYNTGSIQTLLKIVNDLKAMTLVPYLATVDLPAKEQKKIHRFEEPFPMRTIGIVMHKNFAKKKIVKKLKKHIQKSVFPLFKDRNTLKEDGYTNPLNLIDDSDNK